MLSENPECQPQPFDFLVDGELVRMSLEEFLIAKGISAVIIWDKKKKIPELSFLFPSFLIWLQQLPFLCFFKIKI